MLWHQIVPQPRVIDAKDGALSVTLPIAVDGVEPRHAELLERANNAATRILGISGPAFLPGERAADTARTDGYHLTVTSNRVILDAADDAGIASGLATITQALLLAGAPSPSVPPANDGGSTALSLPAVEIDDAPAVEWRGFMLDVARHFFPVASLERVTDILWLLRLNRFHLHLTDDQGWRFPVPEYPALTEVGGFRRGGTTENERYGGSYTVEELRRIDREAALLGITVVPEIDLPGHASTALTAYADLSCKNISPGVQTDWGIFSHVLCTSRDSTDRFLRSVFTAVRDTFTGPYVHIGGDEVPDGAWESCSECSRREDPYQEIVRNMADLVLELGRRPVAWDEASRLDLPRSTIIVNWRRPADAAAALNRGYDLVLAPERSAAYLDHKHLDTSLEPGRLGVCTVADSAAFAPQAYVAEHVSHDGVPVSSSATGSMSSSRTSCILGGQANLWTEEVLYHAHVEYMGIVRLAAVAAGLWSGKPASENDAFFDNLELLRRRLSQSGYTVYTGPFTETTTG